MTVQNLGTCSASVFCRARLMESKGTVPGSGQELKHENQVERGNKGERADVGLKLKDARACYM